MNGPTNAEPVYEFPPAPEGFELWGHDCTRCGNTVPFGEAPCEACGKTDCLLPLYFLAGDLAQMPEGL